MKKNKDSMNIKTTNKNQVPTGLIPIKIDLHLHAKEDPHDSHIKHTAKELIDVAAKKGFGALALTFHDTCYYPKSLKEYAEKKGITLISGAELSIEGKDVLVYNLKPGDEEKIKTFNDLQKFKKAHKELVVIAPHPYFPTNYCLKENLDKNIRLFDGIELSWFYTKEINYNKKAIISAEKYKIPLIATSDLHYLPTFNRSFCTVYAQAKTPASIFDALKKGNFTNNSSPLKLRFVLSFCSKVFIDEVKKIQQNLKNTPGKKKRRFVIR